MSILDKIKAIASSVATSDVAQRATKTFVQAFTSQIIVLVPVLQEGVRPSAVFAVATSALAAGISAVWNGVIVPWLESRKES